MNMVSLKIKNHFNPEYRYLVGEKDGKEFSRIEGPTKAIEALFQLAESRYGVDKLQRGTSRA